MTAVCTDCGHEFSNVKIANSVQAFFEKLDAIDQEVYEQETVKKASKSEKANMLGAIAAATGFSTLANIMQTAGGSIGGKRKVALIEGYPIPNSKEDILEFIVLAASRLKGLPLTYFGIKLNTFQMSEDQVLERAWKTKCKQAYSKAQIVLASDKESLQKIEKIFKDAKIK